MSSYSTAEGTPSLTSINETRVLGATIPSTAPNNPFPTGIYFESDDVNGVDNTQVNAIEIGYRFTPHTKFNADIAFYYNTYKRLLRLNDIDTSNPLFVSEPVPHLEFIATVSNSSSGSTQGAELAMSWQTTDNWHLQYSGTYGKADLSSAGAVSERLILFAV